ncbi:GNAT family N-acetyltransferase [bacterium]|nr:GNAT family N-acetyltransferase [bacterium]
MSIYIAGETLDLVTCPNTDSFYEEWASWFNNKLITKDIHQGSIPHSASSQRSFYEQESPHRLILFLQPKGLDKPVGVCSLSNICSEQRRSDFAMIIGDRSGYRDSLFIGFEAKALMTQYAFKYLPIDRINSSQSINLIKWQKYQILLGYFSEGISFNSFVKNNIAYDEVLSSALRDNVQSIIDSRGGHLWPGKSRFLALMRTLPEVSMPEQLLISIKQLNKEFLPYAIQL